MRRIFGIFRKNKNLVGVGIVCVVLIFFIFSFVFRSMAEKTGKKYGNLVGSSIGFANAMLEFDESAKRGMEKGLSAQDICVDIGNEIREMKKLEILVASVKLSDVHKIGEKVDYAALYIGKGEVVFSVDFSKAEVNGNKILLPLPEGELFIDQSTIEKVSEYQKKIFNGSAEDGFDAYLNSMKKIQTTTTETLNNYDTLMESAKESAVKQVESIANSLSTGAVTYSIDFIEQESGSSG